jgi:hypothetical protein
MRASIGCRLFVVRYGLAVPVCLEVQSLGIVKPAGFLILGH